MSGLSWRHGLSVQKEPKEEPGLSKNTTGLSKSGVYEHPACSEDQAGLNLSRQSAPSGDLPRRDAEYMRKKSQAAEADDRSAGNSIANPGMNNGGQDREMMKVVERMTKDRARLEDEVKRALQSETEKDKEIQSLKAQVQAQRVLLETSLKQETERRLKLEDDLRKASEPKDQNRRKGELKIGQLDMLRFYDLVIDMQPSFTSVIKQGWSIKHVAGMDLKKYKGPIVCVRGAFNKGKSFLLNLLANCGFPSGTTIHTEGLCFKQVEFQHQMMVFLDTAGSLSPLPSVSEDALQEKRAEEDFLRDVSFQLADLFIEVVGEINIKDQTEIFMLSKDMKKYMEQARYRKIMIIHNLRDVSDAEEFQKKIAEIKKLYPGCQLKQQDVNVNGKSGKVEYLDGIGQGTSGEGLEFQMHFWIAQDGTAAGKTNPFVAAKIREIVYSIPLPVNEFDMLERLKTSMKSLLGKFLEPTPTNLDLEIKNNAIRLLPPAGWPRENCTNPDSKGQDGTDSTPKLPYSLRLLEVGSFLSPYSRLPNGSKECGYKVVKTDDHVRVFVPIAGARPTLKIETPVGGMNHLITVTAKSEVPFDTQKEPIVDQESSRFDFGEMQSQILIPVNLCKVSDPKHDFSNGLFTLTFERVHPVVTVVQI